MFQFFKLYLEKGTPVRSVRSEIFFVSWYWIFFFSFSGSFFSLCVFSVRVSSNLLKKKGVLFIRRTDVCILSYAICAGFQ